MKRVLPIFIILVSLLSACRSTYNNDTIANNHLLVTERYNAEVDVSYLEVQLPDNLSESFAINTVVDDCIIYSLYSRDVKFHTFYKYSLTESKTFTLDSYQLRNDTTKRMTKLNNHLFFHSTDIAPVQVMTTFDLDLDNNTLTPIIERNARPSYRHGAVISDKLITLLLSEDESHFTSYLEMTDFSAKTPTQSILYSVSNEATPEDLITITHITQFDGYIYIIERTIKDHSNSGVQYASSESFPTKPDDYQPHSTSVLKKISIDGEVIETIALDSQSNNLLSNMTISNFSVFNNYVFLSTINNGTCMILEIESDSATLKAYLNDNTLTSAFSAYTLQGAINQYVVFASREQNKLWYLDFKEEAYYEIDISFLQLGKTLDYIYQDTGSNILFCINDKSGNDELYYLDFLDLPVIKETRLEEIRSPVHII